MTVGGPGAHPATPPRGDIEHGMTTLQLVADAKTGPVLTGMHDMPGMHAMWAPPVNLHNELVDWPVSLPGVLALGVMAWAVYRIVRARRSGDEHSSAPAGMFVLALVTGILGLALVATSPHGSPFAYAMTVVEIFAGACYVAGVRRLAAKGRTWPVFRTVMFMGGLVTVAVALQTSVATLVATAFTFHVVQHMLLMMIAPPLLALSAPMTLALQTSRRSTKVVLIRILHAKWFGVLTFPVTIWAGYYGLMFAFFTTPLLAFAMSHMVLMDFLNLVFLFGGCNFWWPTIGADYNPRWALPYGMRIINLLIGVPFESFLGIALLGDRAPAAPIYTLQGTHVGGGMVWMIGEVSAFVGTAIVMIQWMRAEDRLAARADRRTAALQRAAAKERDREEARSRSGERAARASRRAAAPDADSAYEEAYLRRGIPVPIILEDDRAD